MKKIIIMSVSDNGFKFGGNMLDSESLLVKYYYARSGYGDIDFNLKCSMSFLYEETMGIIENDNFNIDDAIKYGVEEIKFINDYVANNDEAGVKVMLITSDNTYLNKRASLLIEALINRLYNKKTVEVIYNFNLSAEFLNISRTNLSAFINSVKLNIENINNKNNNEYEVVLNLNNGNFDDIKDMIRSDLESLANVII